MGADKGIGEVLLPSIESIFNGSLANRVWIYGAGGFGRACFDALTRHGIVVSGFIDRYPQNYPEGVNGLAVFPAQDFSDLESIVFIAVLNPGGSHQDLKMWAQGRFGTICFPQDFVHFLPDIARFWLQPVAAEEIFSRHPSSLRDLFRDEPSKIILDLVLEARLGRSFDLDRFVSHSDQYVPDFIRFDRPISFLDVGAFDGDSFLSLLGAGHRVARWMAFEPDLQNFDNLIKTSKRYVDVEITLVPCGLSDVVDEFSFVWDGASSKVGVGAGNTSVCRVVPFDDMYPNTPVDYVKMDIEGGELRALAGMSNLLKRCRPTVAISAYHKWDDIPVLMKFLGDEMPNGQFYLRQHSFSCLDTVLYYVPLERC